MVVAFFDRGDILEATGEWSDDHEWVEVTGGEAGTCWVHRKYITERIEPFKVINKRYKTVKIRKKPSEKGKLTGYLNKGRSIEVVQVLMGWGRTRLGWIDLYFVDEVPAIEATPDIEESNDP